MIEKQSCEKYLFIDLQMQNAIIVFEILLLVFYVHLSMILYSDRQFTIRNRIFLNIYHFHLHVFVCMLNLRLITIY